MWAPVVCRRCCHDDCFSREWKSGSHNWGKGERDICLSAVSVFSGRSWRGNWYDVARDFWRARVFLKELSWSSAENNEKGGKPVCMWRVTKLRVLFSDVHTVRVPVSVQIKVQMSPHWLTRTSCWSNMYRLNTPEMLFAVYRAFEPSACLNTVCTSVLLTSFQREFNVA